MEIEIGQKAPDFSITDWQGNQFVLSSYLGQKNMVLVFNRGFA
jgi:peroxiredoxin